jgi:hypothetical protein
MRKLILAIAAVAALSGCIKMDKTPPKDMPAYVKLYPGSTQVMNMSLGGVTADAFTTTDTPDTVIAFYRTQAASDGLTETNAPNKPATAPDQKQAAFTDPTQDKLLVVVAKPQTGGSMVSLTWKTPSAKAG